MRILTVLSLALATLLGSSAQATTGRGAKAVIVSAIARSSKVMDKTGPFHSSLGGKAGQLVRPFRASNMRTIMIPGNAPNGALGGARLTVGGIVLGTINMKTNRVHITGQQLAKGMR